MSLQFSGVIELIDDIAGSNSTSYPLANKTRDVNLALDRVFSLIFSVGGTWQFDDSNHTDYPIITTNIASGQRDYSFTSDGSSNLILEIHKVFVADSTGLFYEVSPTDVPSGAPSNYWDGQNTQGLPNSYDKLANGIFLDPIPNYNYSGGLKVYINREASYFTTADTTKKAGFAGIFHEYLAFRPAYQFAYRKNLKVAKVLETEVLKMEAAIIEFYKKRERDVHKVLTVRSNNSR